MARTLFTGRAGGFSLGNYSSFNLGTHVQDDFDTVIKNREFLRTLFSVEHLVFMNQSHGTNVIEIISGEEPVQNADAIFTSTKGIGLAVLVADCIPLLISSGSMVAAVHVGRRGLLAGIIQKVITYFPKTGHENISAVIGPCICTHCYEVDLVTYENAISLIPELATSLELHRLDLVAGAKAILAAHDVSVTDYSICTRENQNYFSFRRNALTGRQAGVIAL